MFVSCTLTQDSLMKWARRVFFHQPGRTFWTLLPILCFRWSPGTQEVPVGLVVLSLQGTRQRMGRHPRNTTQTIPALVVDTNRQYTTSQRNTHVHTPQATRTHKRERHRSKSTFIMWTVDGSSPRNSAERATLLGEKDLPSSAALSSSSWPRCFFICKTK